MNRALLILAVSTSACDADRAADPDREPREEAIRAPGLSVSALAQAPGAYDGQTVRIVGEAEQVLAAHAFVLRGEGWLWAAKIPVVARAPIRFDGSALTEGDAVEVIGIVRARVTPSLERELELELGPTVAAALGTGPVLLARTIRRDGE